MLVPHPVLSQNLLYLTLLYEFFPFDMLFDLVLDLYDIDALLPRDYVVVIVDESYSTELFSTEVLEL